MNNSFKKISIVALLILGSNLYLSANVWTQKANFFEARSGVISFSISSKGYFSSGLNSSLISCNDLWEYDPQADTWTQKASNPITRYSGSGFTIDGKGYICLGWQVYGANQLSDLWEFDPSANSWTVKANFIGSARYNAVAFTVGGKAYVGSGYAPISKDFYEYDPLTDQWTALVNTFPGSTRLNASAFTCNYTLSATNYERAFVCGGATSASGNSCTNDLWEFIPGTSAGSGSWVAKTPFPGNDRYSAFAFSINGKGYRGGGLKGSNAFSDFYEYDPINDNWTMLGAFPGVYTVHLESFTINNTVAYCGSGQNTSIYTNHFWEFGPVSALEEEEATALVSINSYSSGVFDLNCKNVFGKQSKLSVFASDGRRVIFQQLHPDLKSVQLNMSEFAKGVYVFTIYSGSGKLTGKFYNH